MVVSPLSAGVVATAGSTSAESLLALLHPSELEPNTSAERTQRTNVPQMKHDGRAQIALRVLARSLDRTLVA